MFTEQDVRKEVGREITFEKGKQLFKRGNVFLRKTVGLCSQ